ncbi:TnsA-like heteromeric transposase endonuclease subunit [Streptomyces sp. DG2A-72]|uniref:TnsA-like heteromeric transposase endonuclease subunit n=1 Tax=Streptomyces sp. DG2A-72 TaxID=3051386 RepID=UPI00265BA474|nr:TnsA-like heteromeric transposase endonuclease subunit [Streptomyces sp. DG2A-72]
MRSFPSWKGQHNYPGLWWSSTLGQHVGYESWLERDHAMLLDFDRRVTGFASQPMWLFWMAGGRRRSHAPDWFARRADGTGLVVDCRPLDRIKPRDAEAFAATERACREIGWEFRLAGAPDPGGAGECPLAGGLPAPTAPAGPCNRPAAKRLRPGDAPAGRY